MLIVLQDKKKSLIKGLEMKTSNFAIDLVVIPNNPVDESMITSFNLL
ncbi:MAG: hypothetical protein JXA54_02475 [Candidatus Heimdallarchaeota archaeon]|nr:hypothetical protein [Candidatus Heimdallarchaeota archaeon]